MLLLISQMQTKTLFLKALAGFIFEKKAYQKSKFKFVTWENFLILLTV
jgi:hypothetical protein